MAHENLPEEAYNFTPQGQRETSLIEGLYIGLGVAGIAIIGTACMVVFILAVLK